ncbi:hypothetical protein EV701_1682 [Chthoniobacter flavus]|nr:hypothetical protein EV701_1682 [Chthoniobacter flavus]
MKPPDAENRTSGGVGALTGANPLRATRSSGALPFDVQTLGKDVGNA